MNHSRVMADYLAFRETSNAMIPRLRDLLMPDDLRNAAERLGLLVGNTVSCRSPTEAIVLMEYTCFEMVHQRLNVFGRMLRDQPPAAGTIEMRWLRAACNAQFALLDVREVIRDFGVVARELISRAEVILVDRAFSQSLCPGAKLATRVVSPSDGWWMTTGACLPVTEEAVAEIEVQGKEYIRLNGADPVGRDRSHLIIHACLKAGASESIQYAAGSGEGIASPSQFSSSPKVGRNDPCPCGSSKKYKKCCGK